VSVALGVADGRGVADAVGGGVSEAPGGGVWVSVGRGVGVGRKSRFSASTQPVS